MTPPETTTQPWTTRRLLAWIGEAFTKQGIDSPRLCAEILVSHVLKCERLKLYLEQDRPASTEERNKLRDLVARGLRHEPIQYLVGDWPFFGIPFKVDRRALIPRPCTELLVERVLQDARARHRRENPERPVEHATGAPPSVHEDATTNPTSIAGATESASTSASATVLPPPRKRGPVVTGAGLRIADICTGSGCIAIAIARNLPQARITATDLSSDALSLARENAARHKVDDRVDFLEGDLLAPLAAFPNPGLGGSDSGYPHAPRADPPSSHRFDALISNPPYIPDHEWSDVPPNVKDFEPHTALRGGPDGLQLIKPIIERAADHLKPDGLMLIYIAASTADAVLTLAKQQSKLRDAEILKDHEGHPRVLQAWRR